MKEKPPKPYWMKDVATTVTNGIKRLQQSWAMLVRPLQGRRHIAFAWFYKPCIPSGYENSKKEVAKNRCNRQKRLRHDNSVTKGIKRFYHGSSKKMKTGANGYKTFKMNKIRNGVTFGLGVKAAHKLINLAKRDRRMDIFWFHTQISCFLGSF